MVRMFVKYPTLPDVEIECNVEECAHLLKLLGDSVPTPRPASTVSDLFSSQKAVKSAGEKVVRNRSYRGKLNRRHMVLNALRELRNQGRIMPRLDDIKQTYAGLYPEEDLTNLDQVVRDLANKTEMVERCERGAFRLSDIAI